MGALHPGLARAGNALRRLAGGLPPTGELVSPVVPNDLFQAHRSLYVFCAGQAAGRRVLDLGCGTGYGVPDLLHGGAAAVLGLDADARCIRYATRRFAAPGRADFRVADPGTPPDDAFLYGGGIDFVTALGLLPRLAAPERLLDQLRSRLAPGGTLVVSLPPVLDGQTLALHRARPAQRSPRYLWDWDTDLAERFPRLRLFRHLPPAGRHPDFADPRPSALDPAEFRFEEISRSEIYDVGTLTAVYVCQA